MSTADSRARPRRPLSGRLLLPLHFALAAALALTVLDFGLAPLPRAALAVVALLPLALCLPGLLAGRKETLRWLALILVLYAGFGCVEVVAAGTMTAVVLLLTALLELALTLITLRPAPTR